MKRKIVMPTEDKEKFDQMCDSVARLELELCGGKFTKGFVRDMTDNFDAHKREDAENFKKMFEQLRNHEQYKTKATLFAGWTWKAAGVLAAFIIFLVGIAEVFFQFVLR